MTPGANRIERSVLMEASAAPPSVDEPKARVKCVRRARSGSRFARHGDIEDRLAP